MGKRVYIDRNYRNLAQPGKYPEGKDQRAMKRAQQDRVKQLEERQRRRP